MERYVYMRNVILQSINVELVIGILSLYGAGAKVLKKHFGFSFLPLGKPFGIIKKP